MVIVQPLQLYSLSYLVLFEGKELKNTAHELYANELDTMYKSSGQLQLHEKRIAFQHTTTFKGYNPALKSKVGTYHAVGCFPTPKVSESKPNYIV